MHVQSWQITDFSYRIFLVNNSVMNDIKRKFIEKMNISIFKEGKTNNNIKNNIHVANKR